MRHLRQFFVLDWNALHSCFFGTLFDTLAHCCPLFLHCFDLWGGDKYGMVATRKHTRHDGGDIDIYLDPRPQ